MYRIVWQYEVRPERLAEFEQVYGPEGEWVQFFRSSSDYIGTDLYRSTADPKQFVTVDAWRSRPAYESFRKANSERYSKLDEWCGQFSVHERVLGMSDDGKD
jgi:heme-degrading monooxygenase HmoA